MAKNKNRRREERHQERTARQTEQRPEARDSDTAPGEVARKHRERKFGHN